MTDEKKQASPMPGAVPGLNDTTVPCPKCGDDYPERTPCKPFAPGSHFTPEFYARQVETAKAYGESWNVNEAETIAFLAAHGVPVRWGHDGDSGSDLVALLHRTRLDERLRPEVAARGPSPAWSPAMPKTVPPSEESFRWVLECIASTSEDQDTRTLASAILNDAGHRTPEQRKALVALSKETGTPTSGHSSGAEGDRDGSVSNDDSTSQRAALGRNEVAQVATARDASPAQRSADDVPAGRALAPGHLLDERVTIGPDPDESKVTGYRIKGPWRSTREAAERDALTLQEADEAHTHLVPATPSSGSDPGRPPITGVALRVDGKVFSLPPPFRHHHILNIVLPGLGIRWSDTAEDERDQGFVDASGRYLTRKQAEVSADVNGQIKNGKIIGGVLTSEDLW